LNAHYSNCILMKTGFFKIRVPGNENPVKINEGLMKDNSASCRCLE